MGYGKESITCCLGLLGHNSKCSLPDHRVLGSRYSERPADHEAKLSTFSSCQGEPRFSISSFHLRVTLSGHRKVSGPSEPILHILRHSRTFESVVYKQTQAGPPASTVRFMTRRQTGGMFLGNKYGSRRESGLPLGAGDEIWGVGVADFPNCNFAGKGGQDGQDGHTAGVIPDFFLRCFYNTTGYCVYQLSYGVEAVYVRMTAFLATWHRCPWKPKE